MRLTSRNYEKSWECETFGCCEFKSVDKNTSLTVQMIAEAMACERVNNADALKNNQAHYRRLAGGIKKLGGRKYLSVSETKTLDQAAHILESLAKASGKAKTLLIEKENETIKHNLVRKKQAISELNSALSQYQNLTEQALLAFSINELSLLNGECISLHLTVDGIFRLTRRFDDDIDKLRFAISSYIRGQLDHQVAELVNVIERLDEPVPNVISNVLDSIEDMREPMLEKHQYLLKTIETIVSV